MKKENITFFNSEKKRIAGRIYRPSSQSDRGIIFSHGLFSTKDGYKITNLAESIVSQGLSLLTFDFSFSGESEGNIMDISLVQEIDDLSNAVKYFSSQGINEIHLMGSSMGGAISLLYLADESEHSISSLILIATPIDLEELLLRNTGITSIDNLPLDGTTKIDQFDIQNKFFKEAKSLQLLEAVKKIKVPVLLFHGQNDAVVHISHARNIKKHLQASCRDIIIHDGDHNLTRDEDLALIRENIIDWFNQEKSS